MKRVREEVRMKRVREDGRMERVREDGRMERGSGKKEGVCLAGELARGEQGMAIY